MSESRPIQSISVFCFIALAFTGRAIASQSPTAQRCGVDQDQPAQRIFANPDGKHGWREYGDVKDVPELELDFGELARLWAGHDGSLLIRIEEPGEDFASYTDYCFGANSQLLQLRYELRTAWGWGFRQEGPILHGSFRPEASEFFRTKTELPIPRPEQADDVSDALKPRVYLRQLQLPFFKLLNRKPEKLPGQLQ